MKSKVFVCFLICSAFVKAEICEFSNPILQAGVRYIFRLPKNETEKQRRFFTQLIAYFCTADNGFDNNGKKVNLSDLVFGKPLVVRDIYLAAKLSEQGKVTVPGLTTTNQQYLALLAKTRIPVEAEEREFAFKFTTLYYNRVPGTEKLIYVVGGVVPLVHQFHVLSGAFVGGSLLDQSTIVGPDFPAVSSLSQFFNDFQGMEDFVLRGIIAPKGLRFHQLQREVGIGDINAMGMLDFHEYIDGTSGVQVGLNVVLPTGKRAKQQDIWNPDLTEGARWQFDPFVNLIFDWGYRYINPLFFFSFGGAIRYSTYQRVPQLKNQRSQVLFPPSFASATVSSFSEYDSSVALLADQAVEISIRPGNYVVMRLANFFEDVFMKNFRVGANYIFTSRLEDKVRVSNESQQGLFNTALLEQNTRQIQHILLWNIAYASDCDDFEAYVGSQYVIAGKNVPQKGQVFFSLRWQF